MTQRERDRPLDERDDASPDEGPDPEELDAVRERTEDLLASARTLIAQTLSPDSEGYVGRLVQDGGQ